MHALTPIFRPKSVALIGASEKPGVGSAMAKNLLNFPGTFYPINPGRPTVFGVACHKSVKDLPEVPDQAIIVIPARFCAAAVKECVEAGIPCGIIISAGFKEMGEPGIKMEKEIMEIAQGKFRIIGPNCLGVCSSNYGYNGTFAGRMPAPGRLAFISQSGALCTAVLDWSLTIGLGFSAFVSIGSMLDLDWGDLIDYFGQDDETDAIILYSEGLGNAESFYRAAKKVSAKKPIVMIKSGRTAAGASAVASHTGSLTGSDDVLDALLDRCGVIRVDEIQDLFAMADVLAKQPIPNGSNLTIVTNAGGPGVISTDALISGGSELTTLSEGTFEELNKLLPEAWSRANPVDILGDAPPKMYADTLAVTAADPNADGMLVILTPQDMSDPTATAEYLKEYATKTGKPVLASWMGGEEVQKGRDILRESGIPCFDYPDLATRMWNYMVKYSRSIAKMKAEEEMESGKALVPEGAKEKAHAIMAEAVAAKRSYLTEYESKKLLEVYGIPICGTEVAFTAEEAAAKATEMGFPVVIKIHSETITHKSDVGGVKVNIKTPEEVIAVYKDMESRIGRPGFMGVTVQEMVNLKGSEVIIGMTRDPQYGPVLVFGAGGVLVEIFKDSALAIPPLSFGQAEKLIQKTKIYHALKGFRGEPAVDLKGLAEVLVRFSYLIADLPMVNELDINPLLAKVEKVIALDARVILSFDDAPQGALCYE